MRQIKAIVTDLDGVLTDGGMYYEAITNTYMHGGDHAEVPGGRLIIKRFHTRDASAALWLKRNTDVKLFVITAGDSPRNNAINAARMEIMHLAEPIFQGVEDKPTVLADIAKRHGWWLSEMAYIGDDRIDLECLKAVGFPGCPADALRSLTENLALGYGLSRCNGGYGVLGDLVDAWHGLGYIKIKQEQKDGHND